MDVIESMKMIVFGISDGLLASAGKICWRSPILLKDFVVLLTCKYISGRSSGVLMVAVLGSKLHDSLTVCKV